MQRQSAIVGLFVVALMAACSSGPHPKNDAAAGSGGSDVGAANADSAGSAPDSAGVADVARLGSETGTADLRGLLDLAGDDTLAAIGAGGASGSDAMRATGGADGIDAATAAGGNGHADGPTAAGGGDAGDAPIATGGTGVTDGPSSTARVDGRDGFAATAEAGVADGTATDAVHAGDGPPANPEAGDGLDAPADANADNASVASGGTGAGGSSGTSAAAGTVGTGGSASSATGGVPAVGGTTSSGGSAPASGIPVLVSTIDLKGASGCPGLRLGDINGDGRMEIVMGQPTDQATLNAYTPQIVVAVTAFDLKGNQLWQYGKPGNFHTASSDIPMQVYDMDGDGKAEVFANMSNTEMTVLDGATGQLLRKIALPAKGSNDSIAFANLRGKPWPQDIIVKTRYSQFWAITGLDDATSNAGTLLWNRKMLPSDSTGSDLGTGHYPLVYDWDGDGKDEVMGGYDFLESDGTKQWTLNSTSHPPLTMHADAIATGDMDGDPANGNEIVVCGNVAAAFNWKTGSQIWQDTHTIEAQQLGIGDYRPDLAGLEVVMLDRLRTPGEGYKSNNVLVDQHDNLLWKENRPTNSGWLGVTENLNNWDGNGTDFIFSYRRDGKSDGSGGTGTYLYDGYGNAVASFPYTGSSAQSFAQHADVCGDGKEEVIVYDETTLWIYANGGCDLNAPPAHPRIPQQFHLHNWSVYTGWITPDVTFYTPGP